MLYSNEDDIEKSINVAFTSMHIINPFIEISKGRCSFLYEDMLQLAEELSKVSDRVECKPNCVMLQT